jgi:hypothetical protein
VTLFSCTFCVPLLCSVTSTYARFVSHWQFVSCSVSGCMSGVGKPFIHAKVAKETAIAMHIRIPLDSIGVNAFVLCGCIFEL